MQNIKIMFRSPRFLAGFIMTLLVVSYALIYPLVNPANPKADRKENPAYAQSERLREAVEAKDGESIYAEIDRLRATGEENVQEVLGEVEAAMVGGGLKRALSGAKQVKKTNKLYAEFADLRASLGFDEAAPADEAQAREALERLKHHHQAVLGVAGLVQAGDAQGAIEALRADEALRVEFTAIAQMLDAGDLAGAEEAAVEQMKLHEATHKWVVEIGARLDAGGYEEAGEALSGIQKTILIPKDSPPSEEFPLGTDNFSRDILLEMAYGARLSLEVGLLAGLIATAIGLLLGLLAGFVGGAVDNIISALTNMFIVIPSMIILILISIAIGQIREGWVTGLVIGLTAWPWTARAVRAQTTSLRNRDHVSMARITGYGTGRILLTEILPYIASYVVMAFILQVASGIMSEATLAILGLGDPTAISLGRMINWAMQYEAVRSGRWWQFIPVACAIAMITFGLYMMNSGMDQVFNPKIRS